LKILLILHSCAPVGAQAHSGTCAPVGAQAHSGVSRPLLRDSKFAECILT